MCVMNHSCVWESFMCVMNHSCVWGESFMYVRWIIVIRNIDVCNVAIRDVDIRNVGIHTFISATFIFATCNSQGRKAHVSSWRAPSCVWHDSFMCVNDSLVCVTCDLTGCNVSHISMNYVDATSITPLHLSRSCVWHDSFMCVTWLIHVCNMTHSYEWHATQKDRSSWLLLTRLLVGSINL